MRFWRAAFRTVFTLALTALLIVLYLCGVPLSAVIACGMAGIVVGYVISLTLIFGRKDRAQRS